MRGVVAAHADIGPSIFDRVIACPGSVAASRGREQAGGGDARSGTFTHSVAALCLTLGTDAADHLGYVEEVEGEVFTLDEDRAERVQMHLDHCRALPGEQYWVEERYTIDVLGSFGTSDFTKHDAAACVLYVRDLKDGYNPVPATTAQLKGYGLGAYLALRDRLEIETIDVGIVQPRIGAIETVQYTPDELERWAEDTAALFRIAREQPDAPREAGSHCKYCPAAGDCPALRAHSSAIVARSFDDLTAGNRYTPELAPSAWLAQVLPHLDVVRDWCSAVEAEARRRLQNGIDVPGWKLVEGRRGNRKWADEAAAEKVFKSFRMKQDEMYDFKLISPATAEKRLKDSPRRWARVEELITREPAKPTIAPLTDKRPAITLNTSAFLDLTKESE